MADNATEITVLHDWDFSVNLSGLRAPTGKGGNVLPTGYYKVELTDLYVNPDRNANRVVIKVQVKEGPFAGALRTTGFNKPTSDDDKVRYYWRGLAESAGYTPAQLDSGEVNLGRGTFKGREAFIFFTDKDDSESGYEDMDFLPPMAWSQQKQNWEMGEASRQVQSNTSHDLGKAKSGSALGGTGPAKIEAAKTLSEGNSMSSTTTSKSQLLEQLGMN